MRCHIDVEHFANEIERDFLVRLGKLLLDCRQTFRVSMAENARVTHCSSIFGERSGGGLTHLK